MSKRPTRTEGGFRVFGPEEIQGLKFVRKAQELGFSLEEIRELLILRADHVPACSHVKDMLEQKLVGVEQKIRELRSLKHSLNKALHQCNRGLKNVSRGHNDRCPVLEKISKAARTQETFVEINIEILYFEGCPNHGPTQQRVQELLKEESMSAEISQIQVCDPALAREIGFLGSPSVRVNGLDVEPAARAAHEYGMMCRTYVIDGGREGLPSREMIRHALHEAESRVLGHKP